MEFDEDFFEIQSYIKQLNPDLVVIQSGIYDSNLVLFQQMMLQIKIYGSKIAELYQSLDEICPTNRFVKPRPIRRDVDMDEVWTALTVGFRDNIEKAMDLFQQVDYCVSAKNPNEFINMLQVAHRMKDQEMLKLCQLFEENHPQCFLQQVQHITGMLQQYSSMIPVLVSENEQLRQLVERNSELESTGTSSQMLQLKSQLKNIELKLQENENQHSIQEQLTQMEEQNRFMKQSIQTLQCDIEDVQFKYNTAKEEIKSYQEQITTLTQSYDKMQNEYKKALQKKSQQIQELEEQQTVISSQRQSTNQDIEVIAQKVQQYKSLYEQKIKAISNNLYQVEQENLKLKDVVRQSALEVDSLRIQIEAIMASRIKKTNKLDYLQLLTKYQELVERNEQLNHQLYSQVLDGSLLN